MKTQQTTRKRRSEGVGFDEWMRRTNAVIVHQTGIGADDLPDFGYADAWEDDATPGQAAREAIEAAGGF